MKNNPYAEMQQEFFEAPPEEENSSVSGASLSSGMSFSTEETVKSVGEDILGNKNEMPSKEMSPEDMREEYLKLKAEAEDVRLRSLAEMENFKRRLQRDLDDKIKYASEGVFIDLLPGLDSLDLAIRYADSQRDSSLLQGVVMTRKLLLEALKKHGLEPVGEVGEAFNHELHEAVSEEECQDIAPMHISNMLQQGYKLKDRLLRPAKVIVSRAKL